MNPKGTVGGRRILVPRSRDFPDDPSVNGVRRSSRRMSAADRRRRNLTWLAGFIVVTFILGLFPALRFLLVLNLVADVLLVAYLGAALYFAARPVPTGGRDRTEQQRHQEPSAPEAVGGSW